MKITDALLQLDAANPNHWTQEGLPRLETIRILLGDPSITREQVTSVAPLFTKTNLVIGEQPVDNANLDDPGMPGIDQGEVAPIAAPVVTLEEQLAELEAAISERTKEQDELNSYLISLKHKRDQLISEIERQKPKETLASTIGSYHEGVKRQLEQRAAARKALMESGVSLNELAKITGGAPIDARRKKRP